MSPVALVLSGILVGLAVGLSGVGGGSLMTPILILLFGQNPAVAVGTDLLFAAATKTIAASTFHQGRRVDWQVTRRLLCGSMPAVIGCAALLWKLERAHVNINGLIMTLLAGALMITALVLLVPIPRLVRQSRAVHTWYLVVERNELALTVVLGAFLGVVISFTSIGAGAFGIVALTMIYPRRLHGDRLVATDIAHALPVALVAGLNHLLMGDVRFNVLQWLLLGSLPATFVASRITMKLPASIVRRVIGVLLGIVSVRLLMSTS